MSPVKPLTIKERQKQKTLRLEELIARETEERGIMPIALEPETLLRRVRDGGWSGEYLVLSQH